MGIWKSGRESEDGLVFVWLLARATTFVYSLHLQVESEGFVIFSIGILSLEGKGLRLQSIYKRL